VRGVKSEGSVDPTFCGLILFQRTCPANVTEGLVLLAIAASYGTCLIDNVVRTYFQDAVDQLTLTGNSARDAPGTLYWKRAVLSFELAWFWRQPVHFLLEAARWTRFRLHLRKAKALNTNFWPATFGGGFLVIIMAPLGLAWWMCDKARMLVKEGGFVSCVSHQGPIRH
jgi:hypothetical protein